MFKHPLATLFPLAGGAAELNVPTAARAVERGPLLRIVGLAGYLIGVGLLARAFGDGVPATLAYALFWGGLTLCYLGLIGAVAADPDRPAYHIGALMLLGAALWLPSYLRNSAYSMFADELHHVQLLRLLLEQGTTELPLTYFPVPGDYPGLEFVGLSTVAATGLSPDAAARLVGLGLHMAIPAVAYLALGQAGLRPRGAFLGALIYCSNTSYYFFHSVFSYESLGILFYLLAALAALRRLDPGAESPLGDTLLLLLAVAAAVATHHVSSLMVALLLLAFTLASRFSDQRGSALGNTAILAAVLWVSWLIYRTLRATTYLFYTIADRMLAILAFILEEQRQSRQLFWNSQLPLPEQTLAYTYPALLGLLVLSGALVVGRRLLAARRAGAPLPVAAVNLGVFGAGAWLVTAPLILTKSSELIYRAWPFLFLGVALYGASALERLLAARLRALGGAIALVVPALLLAGGIIVGDNQAGRLRSPAPQTAAGPEALTADLVAAARWLEADAGQLNAVVGSKSSLVAFADFGVQRTNMYGAWVPFYTGDPEVAQSYLDTQRVGFLVVDWRDSRLLPRYGHYFSQAELFQVNQDVALLNRQLPADRLRKFDEMPGLQRIYDSGDIVLYRNRSVAPAAAQP